MYIRHLTSVSLKAFVLINQVSPAHLSDPLDGGVEGVAHGGAAPVGGGGPVVDVGTEDGLTTQ